MLSESFRVQRIKRAKNMTFANNDIEIIVLVSVEVLKEFSWLNYKLC